MSSQATAIRSGEPSGTGNEASGGGWGKGEERRGVFPATQWSVISQARGLDDAQVAEGLRRLAVGYWRPLYLFLRKRGASHEDASDSVQGFFAFMLGSRFLEYVEREGGKFRSYLLRSFERWLGRERMREGAVKRGGGVVHVPLDELEAMQEVEGACEGETAEMVFDRQWAMEMVGRAVRGLRDEYVRRGRGEWFEVLRPGLPGGGEAPGGAEMAAVLGATEGAVKKAAFDLRQVFGARLREEIRATVQTNEDAEEELRYLIRALGGGSGR